MNAVLTLNQQELSRLSELEEVVRRGQQTFIEVGNALAEIREAKLYRPHKTFEEYCRERWGWSRMQASRLIRAAETVENVTHGLQTAPTSERQVRPLTLLKTSDEQYEAWTRAHEIAEKEGKPVTGRIVAQAVEDIKPKQQKVKMADVNGAVNQSHADKAIAWVDEINLDSDGAKAALLKVINHCNKLLTGATK